MNSGFKKILFLSLVSFFFLAPSCNKENEQNIKTLDLEVLKSSKWFYSAEEFSGDTVIFRPESFDFPPSRGREAFEVIDDQGGLKYYAIGPTDMPAKLDGKWTYADEVLTLDVQGDQFIKANKLQFRILEITKERIQTIMIY
jgi:hypothetical protein